MMHVVVIIILGMFPNLARARWVPIHRSIRVNDHGHFHLPPLLTYKHKMSKKSLNSRAIYLPEHSFEVFVAAE